MIDSLALFHLCLFLSCLCACLQAGAVKDYIKMMLETEQLKFLVFAHHLTMLQACTEAVIEAKVTTSWTAVCVLLRLETTAEGKTKSFFLCSDDNGRSITLHDDP